jgi:hypothetical protein
MNTTNIPALATKLEQDQEGSMSTAAEPFDKDLAEASMTATAMTSGSWSPASWTCRPRESPTAPSG